MLDTPYNRSIRDRVRNNIDKHILNEHFNNDHPYSCSNCGSHIMVGGKTTAKSVFSSIGKALKPVGDALKPVAKTAIKDGGAALGATLGTELGPEGAYLGSKAGDALGSAGADMLFGKGMKGGRKGIRRRPIKGAMSITHPGDMDYTTKKGDMDYHQDGHDVQMPMTPYMTGGKTNILSSIGKALKPVGKVAVKDAGKAIGSSFGATMGNEYLGSKAGEALGQAGADALFGKGINRYSPAIIAQKSVNEIGGKILKGRKSKTHKGELDYTTKKGDKVHHIRGHYVQEILAPYMRGSGNIASPDIPDGITGGKMKKSSPWISHVLSYAKSHGIKYAQALSDPACKTSYHKSKN